MNYKKILCTIIICSLTAGCAAKKDTESAVETVAGLSSYENGDSDASASETSGGSDESDGVSAHSLALAAIDAVEFPKMEEASDAEQASLLFGLDVSLCDDYALFYAPMSVHNNEVVLIKPKDGELDIVRSQIEAHVDAKRQDAVFYPEQQEAMAGAVMGVTDSGYFYSIIHKDGASAEAAIK